MKIFRNILCSDADSTQDKPAMEEGDSRQEELHTVLTIMITL